MEIEVGKFYKTRSDRKVGPMRLNHDDPSHYGHFKAPHETWMTFAPIWHSDGLFWPNQEREQDLIAEWTDAAPEPADIEWGDWGPFAEDAHRAPYQMQVIDIGGPGLYRYPVQKEPVVETVEMFGHTDGCDDGGWVFGIRDNNDIARITFDVIDGKPDWSTLRGEDL